MPQNWFEQHAPRAVAPAGGNWFEQHAPRQRAPAPLPTRPVSAEDFLPPERSAGENVLALVKGAGRSLVGGAVETVKALSDLQRGTLGGDLDAMDRTGQRLRGLVGAQADQFGKAADAETGLEAVGHAAAGLLPVLGPAAAAVGEAFEDDPYAAAGEAGVLVGTLGLPKVAARVPAAAQAAGRGISAAGRAVAPAAKAIGQAARGPAAELAANIPVVGAPIRAVRGVTAAVDMLRRVLGDKAPIVSSNAGGRLVKTKAPTTDAALADVLTNLNTADLPRSVELPPAAELPPGYTPRTTVPKPRAERPDYAKRPSERTAPPKPRPATTHGPRNYFLRKEAPAVAERVEPRALSIEDLPTSWQARTGQPLTKPKSVARINVEDVRAYLAERGMTPEQAIDALSRDRSLKTPDRIRLVEAINQTRFRRAQ